MEESAYTVINESEFRMNEHNERCHWRLVVASSTGGYNTLKETGDAADPLYVAKGPIWFPTEQEGRYEANRRNEHELGLNVKDAGRIVLLSMAASMRQERTL